MVNRIVLRELQYSKTFQIFAVIDLLLVLNLLLIEILIIISQKNSLAGKLQYM